MAGKAIMPVTAKLLIGLFGLPEGTRILAVRGRPDRWMCNPMEIQFLLEADGITETPDGAVLPTVGPTFNTEFSEDGRPVALPEFTGWNESR